MVATQPQEIAEQHAAAHELLSMPNVDFEDHGEIPLRMKRCPTLELFELDKSDNKSEHGKTSDDDEAVVEASSKVTLQNVVCVSSRGTVDVRQLASLIREGHSDRPATTSTKKTSKNTNNKTTSSKSNKTKKTNKKAQEFSRTNLWNETNAKINNTAILRPSHDQWGITKIVLIYCDDFVSKVYEMPWWWQTSATSASNPAASASKPNSPPTTPTVADQMQAAIQPILTLLQIPPRRIVRMLLASLPPSVTIPVHHDSGEWVKHTHRVHVPVLLDNPSKVLFRVGKTDDTLQRVSVHPGHVFEMNNQARHAVSNCQARGDKGYRVHLILDYVDDPNSSSFSERSFPIPARIQLSPGEVLHQTRRSIDRHLDAGLRPTPSFMILGAQKCGTTSLYEMLNLHPWVVRPKRRETHCLDWRWLEVVHDEDDQTQEEKKDNHPTTSMTTGKNDNDNISLQAQRKHCQSFFHTVPLHSHPSCLTGDSTPSYLLHSAVVIPRLQRVFPWVKTLFVVLRNPVDRAYSHYQMVVAKDFKSEEQKRHRGGEEWHGKSFAGVIKEDWKRMQECGLIPYWKQRTMQESDAQECGKEEDEFFLDQDEFDNFVGSPAEEAAFRAYQDRWIPMNKGNHSIVVRGMYALQLRPWLKAFGDAVATVTKEKSKRQYQCRPGVMVFRLESMRTHQGMAQTLEVAQKHLGLPLHPLSEGSFAKHNVRPYPPPSTQEDLRMMILLHKFYQVQNRLLTDGSLLQGKQWNGFGVGGDPWTEGKRG